MKKIKHILSFILAVLLVFPCASVCIGESGTEEHICYVNGFTDGLFHPGETLSRAEVAVIFYNLDPTIRGGSKSFTDVKADAWYADAVSALASKGIMNGYTDGSYKPTRAVTRAEFVVILAALSGKKPKPAKTAFLDVPQAHWASGAISLAETSGWVKGSGGLFRPEDTITRAEAVTAINRFLGRTPDKDTIDSDPIIRYFPDVTPDKWFYYDVMEAAVSHTAFCDEKCEQWVDVTRYETQLPDGFILVSGSLRLIEDGWFVREDREGEYSGKKYHSYENGVLWMRDGAVDLSDGETVIIHNGRVATEDGLYPSVSGLYCIEGGKIVKNAYRGQMFFCSDGHYTSGNDDIDAYIDNIIKNTITDGMTKEQMLRACYSYIYYNVNYRANNNHVGRGADGETWTEQYMLRLINSGKGNCYCYAAEMYYLALRVGYDTAKAVSGGVTPDNLDHGWMTVTVDGEELLLDPELDSADGEYEGSAYMVTYADAPFKYYVK